MHKKETNQHQIKTSEPTALGIIRIPCGVVLESGKKRREPVSLNITVQKIEKKKQ